jgi:hypothetical protein
MMGRAKAFVFAAEEDFGISVVEAQACGTPVICFGKGGVLDSVIAGKTGLFFERQTAESIESAVETFETIQDSFDPVQIRSHAESFSAERFRRQFEDLVLDEAEKREMVEPRHETDQSVIDSVGGERSLTFVNDLAALGSALANRQVSSRLTVEDNSLEEILKD